MTSGASPPAPPRRDPQHTRDAATGDAEADTPIAKTGAPAGAHVDSATAEPSSIGFPIVGIGASAGGLDAFAELLSAVPVNTPLALVLVQHLDPTHESALVDLLARTTRMPVVEVKHGTRVEPAHVYVIPPNATMTIDGGVLNLAPAGARLPTRCPSITSCARSRRTAGAARSA